MFRTYGQIRLHGIQSFHQCAMLLVLPSLSVSVGSYYVDHGYLLEIPYEDDKGIAWITHLKTSRIICKYYDNKSH